MKNRSVAIYYDKFILNSFGGVENYALFLHEKLSAKFEVFFICDKADEYFYYDGSGKELNFNYKLDLILNLSGIDPHKTFKFCHSFKNIPIITILHMDPGDIIYRISSKIGLRSILFIKLLSYIFEKTSKIRRVSKKFKTNYKNSSLTLVIAKEFINKFCSLNGINEQAMGSINYILNPLIHSKKNKSSNPPNKDDKIKIVWAGRNNRQKRPDLAYKFCELIENQSSYELTVFINNDGYFNGFHNHNFLKCEIKKPFKDSIVLSEYDVLILTSDFEGYPLIIIEALSMGLWVICSDSFGAAKSLLNSKELGIVYPYNFSMDQVFEIIKKNESEINNNASKKRRIEYSNSKFNQKDHVNNLISFMKCL